MFTYIHFINELCKSVRCMPNCKIPASCALETFATIRMPRKALQKCTLSLARLPWSYPWCYVIFPLVSPGMWVFINISHCDFQFSLCLVRFLLPWSNATTKSELERVFTSVFDSSQQSITERSQDKISRQEVETGNHGVVLVSELLPMSCST